MTDARLGRPPIIDRTAICSTEDCDRLVQHQGGLCHRCYELKRRTGSVVVKKRVTLASARIPCITPDCGRFAIYASGFCGPCYQRSRIEENRAALAEMKSDAARAEAEQRFVHAVRNSAWMKYRAAVARWDDAPEAPRDDWRRLFLEHELLPDDASDEDRRLITVALDEARSEKNPDDYSPEALAALEQVARKLVDPDEKIFGPDGKLKKPALYASTEAVSD